MVRFSLKILIIGLAVSLKGVAACEIKEMYGDTNFKYQYEDCIQPTLIEHKVDEIFRDNTIEQRYNFIDYHFEQNGNYIRARTYLDEIESVTVYGPFSSKETLGEADDPEFFNLVITYLKRRFFEIDMLADDEGYVTVWKFQREESE